MCVLFAGNVSPPSEYPTDYTLTIGDVLCSKKSKPRPDVIRDHFLKKGKMSHFAACRILDEARALFKAKDNRLSRVSTISQVCEGSQMFTL